MIVFELVTCGLCPCGATAITAHVQGDPGGLRLTDSSLGSWRTVQTLVPGDPRYREAVRELRFMAFDGAAHRAEAQRLWLHVKVTETDPQLPALEHDWVRAWGQQSLGHLIDSRTATGRRDMSHSIRRRLDRAGVFDCGLLLAHTPAALLRLPGVGPGTVRAVRRGFRNQRLNWDDMRALYIAAKESA